MDEEVLALVGERYSRGGPHEGRYSRWGTNLGSIQIGEAILLGLSQRDYERVAGQFVDGFGLS